MALTEEERRQRRMVSNRLSARRSRMKRQRNEEDLAVRAEQLALNNEVMRATIRVVLQHCELVQQENRVRSADARHLYSELERRNSQLRILGQITGMPMDVPEIPAHLTQLYGGLPAPPPPLSPSLPPLSPYLPLLPPSLSLPLQPPPSLPLPLPLEIEMLFQPEPDQSDDVMDDAGSMPWL